MKRLLEFVFIEFPYPAIPLALCLLVALLSLAVIIIIGSSY